MKKLAIIGAGDLGNQIAYHAAHDGHYTPVGFFDDHNLKGNLKNNLPVLGNTNEIEQAFTEGVFDVLMIGIGYRHFEVREALFNRFYTHIPFGSVIHSSSYIDQSCKIGVGVFIYPGCVLDMNVVIANNVLLNVGCVIAHDTCIGQHTFLSPAVKIAGFVTVEEKVSLGIGTTVIDNLKIKTGVRTGGGAVVINNLEKPGLYAGIPAIFKKP